MFLSRQSSLPFPKTASTGRLAAVAWGLAVCLVSPALASPVTALGTHGPIANRVAIIYIGDGFDSSVTDKDRFALAVNRNKSYRDTAERAQPYKRYRNFFNYYRIDLTSPESGIDEPEAATPLVRNTPLDGIGRNSTRLGEVSNSKTCTEVSTSLSPLGFGPTCSQLSNMSYRTTTKVWIYAILNSTGYYNSGGPLCVFSRNYWGEIALHEGGHAHHQLADEYTGTNTLPSNEPSEINVTKDATGAVKWANWVGYNQPGVGTIGAFEGARYVTAGMYRPSNNSKMNQTSQNSAQRYNIVSMEKIVLDIYTRVKPLDAFRDTAGLKTDPDTLWVKTVDPQVLWVDWYIDSTRVRVNGGERFRLPDSLPPGNYRIRARAYDEIVLRSGSNNASPHALDWVRRDLQKLQQEVSWRVKVSPKPVALRASSAPAGSVATMAWFPSAARANASFHLPWDGAYRLRVLTHDGKVLADRTGTGRQGTNPIDPALSRQWPETLLLFRIDPVPAP